MNKKLDNMEIEMLAIISKYHSVSIRDVADGYIRLRSFDKIIACINYSLKSNHSFNNVVDTLSGE